MSQSWQILLGDVRDTLARIPDASVQTAVTSPPYWALRDYGTGWEGGDPHCTHQVRLDGSGKSKVKAANYRASTGTCACGATKTKVDLQIGSEASVDEWCRGLVNTFEGVRRVLRHDGTFWVNCGDSWNGQRSFAGSATGDGAFARKARGTAGARAVVSGDLKPKDLVGQAWMLAFAMRAAGWYLRSAIIWAKPNVLPESCTDRPTAAHEYLFLFSKQERYYYDADAVRQPYSASMLKEIEEGYDGSARKEFGAAGVQNASDVKSRILAKHAVVSGDVRLGEGGHRQGGNAAKGRIMNGPAVTAYLEAKARARGIDNSDAMARGNGAGGFGQKPDAMTHPMGANLRSVWTIPSQPLADAHFATFPEALVVPCIRAGTSAHGGCSRCGAPWKRVSAVSASYAQAKRDLATPAVGTPSNNRANAARGRKATSVTPEVVTLGWEPTCECPGQPDVTPQLVLDPFNGSGTTMLVALKEGRSAVGCELSEKYAAIARKRIRNWSPSASRLERKP